MEHICSLLSQKELSLSLSLSLSIYIYKRQCRRAALDSQKQIFDFFEFFGCEIDKYST